MEYILGVIVSLIAQAIKKRVKSSDGDRLPVYIIVFALSIVSSGLYVLLKDTELWTTIVTILVTAGSFHNFILRRFEV